MTVKAAASRAPRPSRSPTRRPPAATRILVIDVGGTHVKMLVSGQEEPRRFPSGPTLSPRTMVARVKQATRDWRYDAIAIGYPGPVAHGRPVAEPHHLKPGWVGFNFTAAFRCPVRIINDAAMQALGSYRGGTMLFLGLGTGLGSSMIVNGVIAPMELGHLPYRKATYEDYVGLRGLERRGKKKWRRAVADVVERLIAALEPDDVVLGGGNIKLLDHLPPHTRAGDNANAFLGGFRLWAEEGGSAMPRRAPARRRARTASRSKATSAPAMPSTSASQSTSTSAGAASRPTSASASASS